MVVILAAVVLDRLVPPRLVLLDLGVLKLLRAYHASLSPVPPHLRIQAAVHTNPGDLLCRRYGGKWSGLAGGWHSDSNSTIGSLGGFLSLLEQVVRRSVPDIVLCCAVLPSHIVVVQGILGGIHVCAPAFDRTYISSLKGRAVKRRMGARKFEEPDKPGPEVECLLNVVDAGRMGCLYIAREASRLAEDRALRVRESHVLKLSALCVVYKLVPAFLLNLAQPEGQD